MRHRALHELNGNLHIETHNHDSVGECLGRLAPGMTKSDAHRVIAEAPEHRNEPGNKPVRRVDVMRRILKEAGIIA